MSNLFSSFDPGVILILTRIIPALTSASCDPNVSITVVEAGLDSSSTLSTNPTVTRVVTRSAQTSVNSSSNLSSSSLVTTLATGGEAETITSTSSTGFSGTSYSIGDASKEYFKYIKDEGCILEQAPRRTTPDEPGEYFEDYMVIGKQKQ